MTLLTPTMLWQNPDIGQSKVILERKIQAVEANYQVAAHSGRVLDALRFCPHSVVPLCHARHVMTTVKNHQVLSRYLHENAKNLKNTFSRSWRFGGSKHQP